MGQPAVGRGSDAVGGLDLVEFQPREPARLLWPRPRARAQRPGAPMAGDARVLSQLGKSRGRNEAQSFFGAFSCEMPSYDKIRRQRGAGRPHDSGKSVKVIGIPKPMLPLSGRTA